MPTAEAQKQHIPNKKNKSIEMELLINSNSNSNSWEILLTIAIAIAIVPKMSIAIVISILLISSDPNLVIDGPISYQAKWFGRPGFRRRLSLDSLIVVGIGKDNF